MKTIIGAQIEPWCQEMVKYYPIPLLQICTTQPNPVAYEDTSDHSIPGKEKDICSSIEAGVQLLSKHYE